MSTKAAHIGVGVVMVDPESKLFCRLSSFTPAVREQQRLKVLAELGLLEAEIVPVFEEATQTTARFLEAPICILGLMTQEWQWLKSAVGLSRVGLMNDLAASRQLPRSESLCTHVVDSHQVLAIHNTATNPVFAKSLLVQHYGIRAYLGAPLITASGQCLGTLAVMDLEPRIFSSKDIEFLSLMARWSLTEFERNHLLKSQPTDPICWTSKSSVPNLHRQTWEANSTLEPINSVNSSVAKPSSSHTLKFKLLSHLSQELRTPLTSVMGMTSVLSREIYGPLSTKQKEYLDIIHHSGQDLVSLVDEILALGILDESNQKLHLVSVDIEMLCQQAIKSLEQIAKHRQQQIRLSVEPGNRIWLLDKDKVRSILYYLIFSVIQSADPGCVVRIHVSRKMEKLNIALWVSHPWLGDCLPQVDLYSQPAICSLYNGSNPEAELNNAENQELTKTSSFLPSPSQPISSISLAAALAAAEEVKKTSSSSQSRESLGLLLSCELAEIHGGQISVQGSPESGYRYVVALPQVVSGDENR